MGGGGGGNRHLTIYGGTRVLLEKFDNIYWGPKVHSKHNAVLGPEQFWTFF